jgi:hypothetical protein
VTERVADVAMHELDLTRGAVLEKGCVYIAELQERLRLPPGVSGRANPKSSTGRVDVFVRLLTDRTVAFDDVATGYEGPDVRGDRALRPSPSWSAPAPASTSCALSGARRSASPVATWAST